MIWLSPGDFEIDTKFWRKAPEDPRDVILRMLGQA